MSFEENILRRHDPASLAAVEQSFLHGELGRVMRAAPELERHRGVTPEQFRREFRERGRPVVLEGYAHDWPAVRTWSFDLLAQRCADVSVVVDSYSTAAARRATVAQFVELLKAGVGPGGAPIYLQEWYYQAAAPQLAADLPELDIAQYDYRRNLYGEAASVNHQLWLGQAGGVTRLHQDSYMVDVMHVQIVGEKRWSLLGPEAVLPEGPGGAPDFAALCAGESAQARQFVLRPGDVLYLPASWFHRIELLTDSIGLGRKCLDPVNLRLHIHQRMAELLALSLNYDEVARSHPELVDVVMSRNRVWAGRMGIDLTRLRP